MFEDVPPCPQAGDYEQSEETSSLATFKPSEQSLEMWILNALACNVYFLPQGEMYVNYEECVGNCRK